MAKASEARVSETSERGVVATLHRQQANALVAYVNYKKYHWLTYGPLFRDVHLLLDEQATQTYETIDEFAERAIS
jgi:starvation-inducible DNA-binding protein